MPLPDVVIPEVARTPRPNRTSTCDRPKRPWPSSEAGKQITERVARATVRRLLNLL
jgi:hypothetical protein